ncbi:hypothetical protein D3C73_1377950 [compost metagenome]
MHQSTVIERKEDLGAVLSGEIAWHGMLGAVLVFGEARTCHDAQASQSMSAHEVFRVAFAQFGVGLEEETQNVGHVIQAGMTRRGGQQQRSLGQPVVRATEEGFSCCHALRIAVCIAEVVCLVHYDKVEPV